MDTNPTENNQEIKIPLGQALLAEFTRRLLIARDSVHLINESPTGMSVEDYRRIASEDIAAIIGLISKGYILSIAPDPDGVRFNCGGRGMAMADLTAEIDKVWREDSVVPKLFNKVLEWSNIPIPHTAIGVPLPEPETKPTPAPPPALSDEPDVRQEYIKTGMPFAANMFQPARQGALFRDDDEWYDKMRAAAHTRPLATDERLRPVVDVVGYNLNPLEQRVLEAVVGLFSDTGYKGHISYPRDEYVSKVLPTWDKERPHKVIVSNAYPNSTIIPIIHTSQSAILRRIGIEEPTQHDKQRVRDALIKLNTQQYYFTYRRMERDKNGKPVRDSKTGDWRMETVEEVSTLIRIKQITPDAGARPYIEIHPSPAMIDQVTAQHGGNYFLLIPRQWREDVQRKIRRKPTMYEERFMMWCRVEVEKLRRHNAHHNSKPRAYTKEVTWQEVAEVLRMPDSIRKANKVRARKLVDTAYNTAMQVGYINSIESSATGTVLHFNPDFYPYVEDTQK